MRGREVTRLEGFSDAVFGFALTLLVVSLEVPEDFPALKQTLSGFLPFAATFAVVSWIWFEHYLFFLHYKVEDNLTLGAFARMRKDRNALRTLDDVYARFPRLRERREQEAGTLSGGERQMLALGRALMAKPRLLMLDEPSLGLAPLIVREIFAIVSELKSDGVSILLIEQNALAALQVSDYGYVLETGECVVEGPSGDLAANPRVAATYLGAAAAQV